jgi:hypothetical protein
VGVAWAWAWLPRAYGRGSSTRAQLTAQHYTVGTLLLLKSSGLLRDGIRYYEAACRSQFACSAYKSQMALFLLASRPCLHCFPLPTLRYFVRYLRRPVALLIGPRPSPRPFPTMTPSTHLSAEFDCPNTYTQTILALGGRNNSNLNIQHDDCQLRSH